MAQATLINSTFPAVTCRPSDIERVTFDGAHWQSIRIDDRLFLREDELEDMLDGAIDAEEWLAKLREEELVWIVTDSDERTFVSIEGALRVAEMHPSLRGSAHRRFLAWAARQIAKSGPSRRYYGHLSVIDCGPLVLTELGSH